METFSWPDNPIPDANLRNVAEETERCTESGDELCIMSETIGAIARELLECRNALNTRKERIEKLTQSAKMGWETAKCLAVELSAGTGKPSASERAAIKALAELEEL
jgi:hypothetical protein